MGFPADAVECEKDLCRLPSCRCASDVIPSGLLREEIPQMILLTMNDPVRESTYKIYMDLLNEFENPNGCRIKATFFVSHTATEYKYVKQLAYHGRNKFPHTLIIFIQMFSVISF